MMLSTLSISIPFSRDRDWKAASDLTTVPEKYTRNSSVDQRNVFVLSGCGTAEIPKRSG